MKKREAIASIGITNTTAVIITDIDEMGMDESVEYCISVVDEEQAPKSHHAKINYTVKDGEPYFNSIIGRMHLSEAMRVTPFAI